MHKVKRNGLIETRGPRKQFIKMHIWPKNDEKGCFMGDYSNYLYLIRHSPVSSTVIRKALKCELCNIKQHPLFGNYYLCKLSTGEKKKLSKSYYISIANFPAHFPPPP